MDEGADEDVLFKIEKAFNVVNKTWKAKTLSLKTKLKISKSNVKSILLSGKNMENQLQHTQQTTNIYQPLSSSPPGQTPTPACVTMPTKNQ